MAALDDTLTGIQDYRGVSFARTALDICRNSSIYRKYILNGREDPRRIDAKSVD